MHDGNVRTVLELLSALEEGEQHEINCTILEMVLQRPCLDDLLAAKSSGVVSIFHGTIQFLCPELRAVAYSLIPENNKALFPLRVGRDLWEHSSLSTACDEDNIDSSIILFLIAQN